MLDLHSLGFLSHQPLHMQPILANAHVVEGHGEAGTLLEPGLEAVADPHSQGHHQDARAGVRR